MKLHPMLTNAHYTITSFDDNRIRINALEFSRSVLVSPKYFPVPWEIHSVDQLTIDDFNKIDFKYLDMLIIGTGMSQKFISSNLTTDLTSRNIAIECMNNRAACWTYNILVAEERRVLLGLILDTTAENYF